MKTFLAVIHYGINDPTCSRDYFDIELFDLKCRPERNWPDMEPIATWDGFHCDGRERMRGFVTGMEYVLNEDIDLGITKVADR